jgi:hypothetical protein
MAFIASKWFPVTVGFSIVGVAIGLEAANLTSPKLACCLAMFGMGFALDGLSGLRVLPLLAITKSDEQRALTEEILYCPREAVPRYVLAVLLAAAFSIFALNAKSEAAILVALIAYVSVCGIVSFVSLLRAFGEAGARLRAEVS